MPASNSIATTILGMYTYSLVPIVAGRPRILGSAVPLEVTQKGRRGDSLLVE
jgi:hypothetical protein